MALDATLRRTQYCVDLSSLPSGGQCRVVYYWYQQLSLNHDPPFNSFLALLVQRPLWAQSSYSLEYSQNLS